MTRSGSAVSTARLAGGGRIAVVLVAAVVSACGGPAPTERGQASPGATGPGGPFASDGRFPQPSIRATIPGLYTDSSVYAVGDERVALLLSDLSCRTLADQISAGEWREVVRILGPASLGPNVTPPPSLPDLGWLVLERGSERMTVRLGGRTDCSAWATRTALAELSLSGTFQAGGQAIVDQDGCLTTAGSALMRLTFAPQGSEVRVAVSLTVPLRVGEHILDTDSVELIAGRVPLSLREIVTARRAELQAGGRIDGDDPAGATVFAASSRTAARVAITATDPLAGTLTLDGWLGRAGETASLTAEIACHLPGGELTRAVAAAGPAPGGSPGPGGSPEPGGGAGPTGRPPAEVGQLSLTFANGPDAGPKSAGSADISCEYGIEQPGTWSLGWAGIDERPGNVIGLLASVPIPGRTGPATGAAMTLFVAGQNGEERQYAMGADSGGSLTIQAAPGPGVIHFDFSGRTSDGTRVTGRLICPGS